MKNAPFTSTGSATMSADRHDREIALSKVDAVRWIVLAKILIYTWKTDFDSSVEL